MNLDRWGMARENAHYKLEQEAQIQIYRRRLLETGKIIEEELVNGKALNLEQSKMAYEVLAEIHAAEARLDAPDAAKLKEYRLRLKPILTGAAAGVLNDPSKYKGPRRHEDLLFAFQNSPPPPPEFSRAFAATRAIGGSGGGDLLELPSSSYSEPQGSAPSLWRRGAGSSHPQRPSNEQIVKGLTHRIALRAMLYGTAGATVLGSFVFLWGLSQVKADFGALGKAAGGLQSATDKSRRGISGRG